MFHARHLFIYLCSCVKKLSEIGEESISVLQFEKFNKRLFVTS